MAKSETRRETTVNHVCRRHRFGPIEIRIGPDDTVAIGPSGAAARVDLAVSPFPSGGAFRGDGIDEGVAVEVDGAVVAHLVQPTHGFRRHDRRIIVRPAPGSPLRPSMYLRLRWWRRVTLETPDRGLVARRFWPVNPHRPHTEDDVDEVTFLVFMAAAGVVRASLGIDLARSGG